MKRRLTSVEISPWKLYLVILAIVFVSEFCVMLILPLLPMQTASRWLVGLVDAGMLTLFLVPLFGWLIVRPLMQMAALRTQLLKRFFTLQEEERGRLARDLHDEIGQSFTSVLIGLRTMEPDAEPNQLQKRLQELAGVVAGTLQEVRRMARGLRPAVLDHLGLVQAIDQYLGDFQRAHKVDVALSTNGLDGQDRLPPAINTAVYRIVQESLTNVARHAHASRVRVLVRRDSRALFMEISDNGQGFVNRRAHALWSTGLLGMTERAVLLYGKLNVASTPGKGTRVSLRIPLLDRRHG